MGRGGDSAQLNPSPASPSGQHVLLGLRFQELSWDHTSPEEEESVLWLEFDGDNEGTPVNKLLKIYSKQVVGVACTGRGGWPWLRAPQTVGGSRLAHKGVSQLLRAWGPGWLTSAEPGPPLSVRGLGFPVLCDQPALAPHPQGPPGVGCSQRRSGHGRAKAPPCLCFTPLTQPSPPPCCSQPRSWHRPPSHTSSFRLSTDMGQDSCLQKHASVPAAIWGLWTLPFPSAPVCSQPAPLHLPAASPEAPALPECTHLCPPSPLSLTMSSWTLLSSATAPVTHCPSVPELFPLTALMLSWSHLSAHDSVTSTSLG